MFGIADTVTFTIAAAVLVVLLNSCTTWIFGSYANSTPRRFRADRSSASR